MKIHFQVGPHAAVVTGRVSRIVRLRDEYYDCIENPVEFKSALQACDGISANLLTFIQSVPDPVPKFDYHREWDAAAVLRISSYDYWWKKQINDKTRNMIRKAGKAGVEIRLTEFCDDFVNGIVNIYNESPLRQGRRFLHYGKSFETIKRDHATFLDQSEFFGAYYNGDLIGFIKLVHGNGVSNLMQIISMISHRDKAPTNALIAKAVERCAEKCVPLLHYGTWSRRSMGEFKKHHAFERLAIPRYYVPLNLFGGFLLKCGFHRAAIDRVPGPWLDRMAEWRGKWNNVWFSRPKSGGAVAQLAERRS